MRKKLTAVFLTLGMMLTLLPAPAHADLIEGSTPNINAVSYIIVEGDTGEVIFGQNYEAVQAPANLTQMMTAVLAIESGKLDETVTIGQIPEEVKGTNVYLRQGEKYTLRQLTEIMIVWSANDAAYAIGNYVGGNSEKFVTAMNKKAQEIGMTSTNFTNSYGLTAEGQVSNARDLALLACYAMELEDYRKFASTSIVNWSGESYQRPLGNKNQLLTLMEEATGVKGCTASSDGDGETYAIAGSAQRDSRELVGIILGGTSDEVYENMKMLLNYGFDHTKAVPVVQKDALQTTLVFGEHKVRVIAGANYSVLQANDTASIVSYQTELNNIELPIKQNQEVGKMEILVDGNVVDTVPLLAQDSAGKSINWLLIGTSAMTLLYICQILFRLVSGLNKKNKKRKKSRPVERTVPIAEQNDPYRDMIQKVEHPQPKPATRSKAGNQAAGKKKLTSNRKNSPHSKN